MSATPFRPCLQCAPHFTRLEAQRQASEHCLLDRVQEVTEKVIARAVAEERERCARECEDSMARLMPGPTAIRAVVAAITRRIREGK